MNRAREYTCTTARGYRFGTRCYPVSIYEGEPGDTPVLVCRPSTEISGADDATESSRYLAAEVMHG